MKLILSVILILFVLFQISTAVDCGKYKNPLTCAGQEPPCFWDGKVCKEICPHCKLGESNCANKFDSESCDIAKAFGCYWENDQCLLSKFQCSSIHNEFDCTIENCVWSYKDNKCHE